MSRAIKDYCPLRCKLSKYIPNLQFFYNIFQNYLLFFTPEHHINCKMLTTAHILLFLFRIRRTGLPSPSNGRWTVNASKMPKQINLIGQVS